MNAEQHRELNRLVDALCEGTLTAAQMQQLESMVLGSAEARARYLDQIELHGLLHWDAANGVRQGNGVVATASKGRSAASSKAPVSRRRAGIGWAVAAGLLIAVVAVVPWLARQTGTGQPDPIAESGLENPGEVAAGDETGAPVEPPPVIQLTNRSDESPGDAVAEPESVATSAVEVAEVPADRIPEWIDAQIARAWQEYDVAPSPPAEDAEWFRRVHLDLLGYIPEASEVEAFLADTAPGKTTRVVSRLLEHPDSARHFATIWTNLLVGRTEREGVRRESLHEFLENQFHANRPWDELVADLIAAEGTDTENPAAVFLLANLNNEAVPATALTARLFLGTQVQCMQCHKHPWYEGDQEQFWALNSFFQQTQIARVGADETDDAAMSRQFELVSAETGGPTYYETLRGVMKATYPQFAGQEIDDSPETNRRRELARLMSLDENRQMASAFVNRLWAHFFGYGFTRPIDDMGPHNPPTHPELLEGLAQRFAESGYDVRKLTQWICETEAYRLTSRFSEQNRMDDPARGEIPLFSRMYVKPLSAEQVYDSLLVATCRSPRGRAAESIRVADREEWLQPFFSMDPTEENCEQSTFDGSLPQSLELMNGPLVRTATSAREGTVLHEILTTSASDANRIRQVALATVGRAPTDREMMALQRMVQSRIKWATHRGMTPRQGLRLALQDVYWAYLNSNEFVTNH
ncbi:hypothetical protein Mal4_43150 [Maioricimonas rarisocia]|uniref:DUF1549 domain-containing protein n=1 Tax=Maioricimonas rarisocia TaxID=2528026 RepID=A0A517ZBZ0_9PLAN|nr:DUF1549 domain-containing protein [Maioricimonas rarisocia]QDU39961.1 hypothetical protein Mal4_43150 [Maioricimonas rarisocia]